MQKFYPVLFLLVFFPVLAICASLTEITTGKILIQVEQNGEAWYVYPENHQRYFLGRPDDAFSVMRSLGLGIASQELDEYLKAAFPPRLSGMILLDVQRNGEAYYIYPDTLKGHYLGKPADAFEVMRSLGLGISNADLAEIPASTDSPMTPDLTETTDSTNQSSFDVAGSFLSQVTTEVNGNRITVKSNGLPDHETGDFPNSGNPNTISEQEIEKTFTLSPQLASSITSSKGSEFGIALNGILFEPLTGEYYNNDPSSGWNLEWSTNNLGFDFNNAHVQPDGTYHYHGSPTSLLAKIDGKAQTLLGFAADGFPIYFENKSASYRLKSGTRPDGPGGAYDGTYVEDYEYVEGLGDLDECNGMTGTTPEYPNGTYYYVISETFPIISRCFSGTPDSSFQKGPGGGLPGGQPGGQLPPPRF